MLKEEQSMALKMPTQNTVKVATGKGPIDYTQQLGVETSKPIKATTTIEKKVSGEGTGPVGKSETIHKGVFGCKMQIAVEGGQTLNLGNYESARIGVVITVPCDPETLDEAYEWASNWISEKLGTESKSIKGM